MSNKKGVIFIKTILYSKPQQEFLVTKPYQKNDKYILKKHITENSGKATIKKFDRHKINKPQAQENDKGT